MTLDFADSQLRHIIHQLQNAERFGDSKEKEQAIRNNIHILQQLMFTYARDK
jgi:hypothetical protein